MSVDWDEGYKKGKKDERERVKELKEELKKEVMKHAQERGHPFIDGVIENKFKEYGIGEKKRKCLKKI